MNIQRTYACLLTATRILKTPGRMVAPNPITRIVFDPQIQKTKSPASKTESKYSPIKKSVQIRVRRLAAVEIRRSRRWRQAPFAAEKLMSYGTIASHQRVVKSCATFSSKSSLIFKAISMTKILIVDDDVEITSLFAAYLTTEGYKVTSVNQSSTAVQAALELKPDLVVLDLMMPDPDGFKVCRTLRKFPNFAGTPILIVTALNDEDSKIVAYGAGADGFLSKPFPISVLGIRIKELLNKG